MPSPYEDPPTVDFTPESEPEPYVPPRQVEAKLVVASTLAGVLYVVAGAVQENTAILEPLPPWLRSLVLALLPTLLAFAAGWRVPSNRA